MKSLLYWIVLYSFSALQFLKDKTIQIVNHRRALKEKKTKNLLDIMLEADDLYQTDQQVCCLFHKLL